jgi:hypothetical protein
MVRITLTCKAALHNGSSSSQCSSTNHSFSLVSPGIAGLVVTHPVRNKHITILGGFSDAVMKYEEISIPRNTLTPPPPEDLTYASQWVSGL